MGTSEKWSRSIPILRSTVQITRYAKLLHNVKKVFFLTLEKEVKKGKVLISRLLQFLTGVSDCKYESCYEFLVILLSTPHIKYSLFPDILSYAVD
jgi:hypothetical protein